MDALAQDHYIIAPDWRGYGQTETPGVDNFWFADYLADLDFLLDHYAGDQPIHLVGHSLGGNVAMAYGGRTPERIRRLVNLEGFGLPARSPTRHPGVYAQWIDELKELHRGELNPKAYSSMGGVTRRLMKTNPRLSQDKADWLAQHWAHGNSTRPVGNLGHPAHKIISATSLPGGGNSGTVPQTHHARAGRGGSRQQLGDILVAATPLAEYHKRLPVNPQVEIATIPNAGHMLHHDQPELLAEND